MEIDPYSVVYGNVNQQKIAFLWQNLPVEWLQMRLV